MTITYARANDVCVLDHLDHGDQLGHVGDRRQRLRAATPTPATSPTLNATATVSGSTVKLTVTKVNDPSAHLNTAGPGAISGVLASTIKDTAGHPASSATFTTSSIRLF